MNQLENRLGTMLEERARRGPNGPELDDVLRQSGRIKRRRTTAAAAGIVAAVALAIGVPYAALDHTTTTRPSQPSLSPNTGPGADVAPGLAALAAGQEPAIDWWQGSRLHRGDGSAVTLPALPKGTQYWGVSPYRGGWLTARSLTLTEQSQSTSQAIVTAFDDSGKPTSRTSGAGRLLTSPDGTQVAWWTADQRLHVGATNGRADNDRTYRTDLNGARPAAVHPLGFTASGEVVYVAFEHDNQPDLRVTEGADRARDIKGFDNVQAFDPGRETVAGSVYGESAEQGRVATLDGTVVWSSTRWKPLAFSPDGSKVLAASLQADRGTDYAVLEAGSGKVVTRISFDKLHLSPRAWKFENDDDVIFEVSDTRSTGGRLYAALVRWSPGESVKRATGISVSPKDGLAIDMGTQPSNS